MLNKKDFFGYNENNIYLDNAASTLALKSVRRKANRFLLNYGSIHRGAGRNSELSSIRYENARNNILSCIHGDETLDTLIFTANTTDSINKFSLIYEPKEKILVSNIEHSANYLPWIKRHDVIEMETEDFHIKPEIVEKYLKENKISLVAISASSNISGYATDFKTIYELCQKYGARLFLDMSQYAPHFIPDLRFCDMMAYCGHKMYAPFGIGVLAGRKYLLQNYTHSFSGGGNVVYVDNNRNVVYKDLPYAHEYGTPNGIGAVALSEAHNVLYKKLGEKALKEHGEKLSKAIEEYILPLKEYQYEIFFAKAEENKTPIFLLRNKKLSTELTVQKLNSTKGEMFKKRVFVREGAFCAYRAMEKLLPDVSPLTSSMTLSKDFSLIRFSAGLINDEEDILYVANKLKMINREN